MKVLQINSVCGYGSTGKICTDIYDLLAEKGHDCCIAYGRNTAPKGYKTIKIGNKLDNYFHVFLTRFFDLHGFGSKRATKKLIQKIKEYDPDIIHLHNIHGYYLNIEILFKYLKESNKQVVWTLHDCWTFTGHCASFLIGDCNKWMNGCNNCPLLRAYPTSLVDFSKTNWIRKKEIFLGLKNNLVVVAVSNWLENQIKYSFLSNYEYLCIKNGINTNIFKPSKSNFREKHNLVDKKIILGVSNVWNTYKGINDFFVLSNKLDSSYKVVLVGLSKEQIESLPQNVIGIERTVNQNELAEIYTAADIYVNFSKAETFGLTNFEAQSCGTTTLSLNSGGTKETLLTPYSYLIKDVEEAYQFIINYDYTKENTIIPCFKFDKEVAYEKYIELYERILK